MKIVLIGNCQTTQACDLLNYVQGIKADRIGWNEISKSEPTQDQLEKYDIFIMQDVYREKYPALWRAFANHKKAVALPVVYYSGFHPDVARIGIGGVVDMRSRIVTLAHLTGLSIESTRKLFSVDFYERLGYYLNP